MMRKTVFVGLLMMGVQASAQSTSQASVARVEAELTRRGNALESERQRFNTRCGKVEADDAGRNRECGSRRAELMARIAAHDADVAAVGQWKEKIQNIERDLLSAENRMRQTRSGIEAFRDRIPDFMSSLEEWTKLPQDAREQALNNAKEAALASFLGVLARRSQVATQLAERDIDRIATSYKRKTEGAAFGKIVAWQDGLYRNLRAAKTEGAVVTAVETSNVQRKGLSELHAQENGQLLSQLLLTIELVNIHTVKNPAVGLLIADGQLVVADAYAWVGGFIAQRRVDQLLDLGTVNLESLKSLQSRYERDVRLHNDTRQKLTDTLAQSPLK